MDKKRLFAVNVFKLLWSFALTGLEIIRAIASDKPRTPRYSPLKAHLLYEQGLISNVEYKRCLGQDY